MNQEPEFDDILNAVAQTLETGLDADQTQQTVPRTWGDLQRLSQITETPRRDIRRQQLAEDSAVRVSKKAQI